MSIILSLKSQLQKQIKSIKTWEAFTTMMQKPKTMECRHISCQLKTTKRCLDLSLPICQQLEVLYLKDRIQDLLGSTIPKIIINTWISTVVEDSSNMEILAFNTHLNISSSWVKKLCNNRCLTLTSSLKCQQWELMIKDFYANSNLSLVIQDKAIIKTLDHMECIWVIWTAQSSTKDKARQVIIRIINTLLPWLKDHPQNRWFQNHHNSSSPRYLYCLTRVKLWNQKLKIRIS